MEARKKERKIAGSRRSRKLSGKDENGSAHDVADERGRRAAETDAALELLPFHGWASYIGAGAERFCIMMRACVWLL